MRVLFKVWGNDTGKYVHWDNTINKLSVLGNVDFGNALIGGTIHHVLLMQQKKI